MLIQFSDYMRPTNLLSQTWIGKVVSNNDPIQIRRLKVSIAGLIEGNSLNLPWANDLSMLSGSNSTDGFHMIPEVGSTVYVTFPTLDINNPYYKSTPATSKSKNGAFGGADYLGAVGFSIQGLIFKYKKEEQELTILHPSGTEYKIIQDGSINIKSAKDVTIDGSGGKAKFSDGKVAIGSDTDELLDLMSQTLNFLATDKGNLGLPFLNAAQYQQLKVKLDAIKGTL